jgi:uncharacterized Ntn-hydrolase superfamily protein
MQLCRSACHAGNERLSAGSQAARYRQVPDAVYGYGSSRGDTNDLYRICRDWPEAAAMTFSIAGLCPRTGEMGCVLATSSLAAGARAQFVSADAGVVISQARSDPRLGVLGIHRLQDGDDAHKTLGAMIDASPHAAWRQLAVVDRNGTVSAFTGSECTEAKGEVTTRGAVVVGNGLANGRVPIAMMAAFQAAAERSLAERLIVSLEAGLEAGGEAYPLRSAALKIARPGIPLLPIDLRVDCSETPIAELRRIWQLWVPMVDGYVQRCVDPANAPPAAVIEGHI